MSKAKRNRDPDYDPNDYTTEESRSQKSKLESSNGFLTQNKKMIWDLHSNGAKPGQIANALCSKHGLKNAISAKQVSNWIQYHKKSGQHPTRPITPKNNNLRPDSSDFWYSDAKRIAKEDGKEILDSEDDEELFDEEEENNAEAKKFIRFFEYTEDNVFTLFVECGINRKITATPTPDHLAIELMVFLPLPPDEMFRFAGFKHTAKMNFEETKETFTIQTPSKISTKTEFLTCPNKETPIWIIFKYFLESVKEEKSVEVNIDLLELLINQK